MYSTMASDSNKAVTLCTNGQMVKLIILSMLIPEFLIRFWSLPIKTQGEEKDAK